MAARIEEQDALHQIERLLEWSHDRQLLTLSYVLAMARLEVIELLCDSMSGELEL